ncbi:hypothetical protein AKJ09_04861 [Labilithrix luteola]|uniref:Rax2-like C-terminal domain-containing protein n=1 Tax=Labilithrix luteola TaxID=1391654 RepID=A0A0K1PXF2_9BACT|nr:hypothetical protein [Labilithrix luteola]AKU98197.1 hypothetical protein AKJ09_04861 [Labilithrix luteola]
MRRFLVLAVASAAMLSLAALPAGCSNSESNGFDPDSPDAQSPDSGRPQEGDASVPDAASDAPYEAGPHEQGWDPSFSLPGVAGRIHPTVTSIARVANRQIALAGTFEQAGSVPVKFVAFWNGNQWLSIGNGLPDSVDVMAALPTGELIATVPVFENDATVYKLFKWNKTTWSEVASFDGWVKSLDVAPDGTIYAAGWFSKVGATDAPYVAKFDGTTWSAFPGVTSNVGVIRLVGGKPCVGGLIGGDGVGLQCLEGGSWVPKAFGPQANGEIMDIVEQNGDLVAAGRFNLDWESSAGSLARWNGATWQLIGGGVEGVGAGEIRDVEVDGDKIYIAGEVRFVAGQKASGVAMFDTTQNRWSSLNDGVFGSSGGFDPGISVPASVLAKDQGGEIYVGGGFSLIGGRIAVGVARWDGNQWNPVDDPKAKRLGVNASVHGMAEATDGSLYVVGEFEFAGGDVATSHVGRLQNDAWKPLGFGLDGPAYAVAAAGNTVYVGGAFTYSGTVVLPYIAQWNGATWSGVGSGFDSDVTALVVGPDGALYAGGSFSKAGATVVNHVAKWDGHQWSPLGDGFDNDVQALAFGSDGKLYAGGGFTHSGATELLHVAVWEGTKWSALGPGVDDSVHAMTSYDGKLTIGGSFITSGSEPVEGLASWDGTRWTAIGGGVHSKGGFPGYVQALTVHESDLYVGGVFDLVGTSPDGGAGTTVASVAKWSGTTWSDLSGGAADAVNVLVSAKDNLWVGGSFTFTANRGSAYIGRYWFTN